MSSSEDDDSFTGEDAEEEVVRFYHVQTDEKSLNLLGAAEAISS